MGSQSNTMKIICILQVYFTLNNAYYLRKFEDNPKTLQETEKPNVVELPNYIQSDPFGLGTLLQERSFHAKKLKALDNILRSLKPQKIYRAQKEAASCLTRERGNSLVAS